MAEDVGKRLRRVMGQLEMLETDHDDIDERMLLMISDGLSAMAYGQYGGSFPDPTPGAVYDVNGAIVDADGNTVPVRWRDHRPEDDRETYWADLAEIEKRAARMDVIRRNYKSANQEMWNRLDPTDFCRIHWFIMHREPELQKVIPRRIVGDLCKDCNQFRVDNGRPPEPTEVDKFIRSAGREWPHKLVDPKERRAV